MKGRKRVISLTEMTFGKRRPDRCSLAFEKCEKALDQTLRDMFDVRSFMWTVFKCRAAARDLDE